MIYFKLSELCITDDPIPQPIADKLLKYHITPMSVVRGKHGAPIFASSHSGWRPEEYEKARGRSGGSQHCFKDIDQVEGKGAVDWTAEDMEQLLLDIIQYSTYTRVTYYKEDRFIHCDFKYTGDKGIQYFESGSNSKWTFIKYV